MSDPGRRRVGRDFATTRVMNRLVAAFLAIPAPWVAAIVFVMPALETGLMLGALLPGEVVVILGGVIAGRGGVSLAAVIAAGIAGPIAGDVTGYLVGRRYGEAFVRRRLGRRWGRAHRWLSKKQGGLTIFLGRFLPFLRSVLPMTAGAVKVPARRFLAWDIAAACVWGTGSALLGFYAARDFDRILQGMHRFSMVIGIAVLLAAAAAAFFMRKRKPTRASPNTRAGRKGSRARGRT